MDGYGLSTWGDRLADVYDEYIESAHLETDAAVDLLAELAGKGGRALELGIGDGRLAVPLAARGVQVEGIEASEQLIARLRARPGGDRIPVSIGDFAAVEVEGVFDLVYAGFNTFFDLYRAEDQLRCLQNARAHLGEDGLVVLEVYVPETGPGGRAGNLTVDSIEPDRVILVASRRDPLTETIDSAEIWITERGIRLFPSRVRPIPPGELDLMAGAAGLRLRDRWGGWRREPFGAASTAHVSVYEAAS